MVIEVFLKFSLISDDLFTELRDDAVKFVRDYVDKIDLEKLPRSFLKKLPTSWSHNEAYDSHGRILDPIQKGTYKFNTLTVIDSTLEVIIKAIILFLKV